MSQVIFGNQDAGNNMPHVAKTGLRYKFKIHNIWFTKINTHPTSDMYHQERKQTTTSEYFKVLHDVLGK